MSTTQWIAVKEKTLSEFEHLVDVAKQNGMLSLARELEMERIPKLQEERFSIVVIGEFNHGKSSFVNALIGSSLLPVGITPTTATINHLVYAQEPSARAVMEDGSSQRVDPAALQQWVTIDAHVPHTDIRYVEVGIPSPFLADHLTLVDTPGVNDISEARAQITYQYIPQADFVVFLLDATQILKQSERVFLEQRLLRRSRDKLIFVIGKGDLLSAEEKMQALAYCRKHVAPIVDDPVLFIVSARLELQGNTAESGMAPLKKYIEQHLEASRKQIFWDNALAEGQRLASYLEQNLGIRQMSLSWSTADLEQKVIKIRAELLGKQQKLQALQETMDAEVKALQAKVALDADAFANAFCEALPQQIDRANAKDIQLYLQGFLQDTLKGWAEQEGEMLAGLLEKLAERIIQVANENVSETFALLQSELGVGTQPVLLSQVDFVKYDVGVIALGALGTSLYLFVNTVVGGVLTLAAPLVSMLLHAWLSGQVKEHAKKHAPTVVRDAVQAAQTRFSQSIAEVVTRLSDYVAAAGTTLYQNISEILDHVLEEKRIHQVDATEQQRQLAEQQKQVEQIQTKLGALRETLWTLSKDLGK